MCATLLPLARRIDVKLYDYKSKVVFDIKRNEALALHAAYKYGWLPKHELSQEIFEMIDRII